MLQKNILIKILNLVLLMFSIVLILCSCSEEDTVSKNDFSSSDAVSEEIDAGVTEEGYETFNETDDVTLYGDEFLFDDTVDEEWQFEE